MTATEWGGGTCCEGYLDDREVAKCEAKECLSHAIALPCMRANDGHILDILVPRDELGSLAVKVARWLARPLLGERAQLVQAWTDRSSSQTPEW